jgi:hypothetical protein
MEGGREGGREETSGFQAGAIPESWLFGERLHNKSCKSFPISWMGQDPKPWTPSRLLTCFASSRKKNDWALIRLVLEHHASWVS